MPIKTLKTKSFEMHIYEDGIVLLPPPQWLLELMDMIESKSISHQTAKIVLEEWQRDILAKLGVGIQKLKNLGMFSVQ